MKRKGGAVLIPWLIIFLMIGSLLWLLNRLNQGLQNTEHCRQNLEKIHIALLQYEQEHGRLPALELYPVDSPGEQQETLIQILENQAGAVPAWLQCPGSAGVLREQGVTYLWNTEMNQSSLTDREEITWLLVDIHALDDTLPGPHFGQMHILYSDGSVERSDIPPPGLPVRF